MACEGCDKKHKDEKENSAIWAAQELANETGQWVGIYTDEYGKLQYTVVFEGQQYPRYVTPKLQNA